MKTSRIRIGLPWILALLIAGVSDAQTIHYNKSTKNKEVIMSTAQRNKEVIRKLYEQSLNKRNLELLNDLVSEDFVGIRGEKGAAAFQEPVVALMKAFPDVQWNIEELVAEDDKVIVRWKLKGTHKTQFQNFAATGKAVTNDGIGIYELKDGKIIKAQVHTDRLGFLQQLDVLPIDLTSLSAPKSTQDRVNFIDRFFVPAKAKQEFMTRVSINRNFIKTLPGFIGDAAYERTDENGDLIFITVAVWENLEAVKKAKEAVQAEYKKEGFDPAAMFERLNITIDRGIYKEDE